MTEEIKIRLYELAEEKYREFNQKLLPGVEHVQIASRNGHLCHIRRIV